MSILKNLSVLSAVLLAGSALASEGAQDTSFLKKDAHKKHHHNHKHHEETLVVVAPVEVKKTNYFVVEGSYNFNNYKPTLQNSSTTSKKYHDTGTFGIGAGLWINENFKTDLVLGYTPKASYNVTSGSNKLNSDVTTTSLLLNGSYNFTQVSESFVPYVSAGLGIAYNQLNANTTISGVNNSFNKKKTEFAYQAGLGVAYKLSGDTTVSLGYRFVDNGKGTKIAGVNSKRLQSNQIVAALNVPF